ncbi:MAG: hypothetical protein ABR499_16280 [Gemmatimonadaceae bacterium]
MLLRTRGVAATALVLLTNAPIDGAIAAAVTNGLAQGECIRRRVLGSLQTRAIGR